MRAPFILSLWLIAAAWPALSPASAAPYRAMALGEGYRMTARHDGQDLQIGWRPYDSGNASSEGETSTLIVSEDNGPLTPISGSQAAFLKVRADLSVVIDTRDENLLFDQLSAIRVMLAAANFSRQTWRFYDASSPDSPISAIASNADLASGWASLRALLEKPGSAKDTGPIPAILQQLAGTPGDRKALILPQSLMPALRPGLTPQGIAGLQAFGISLYPMTGALPAQTRAAYETLAGATGGRMLPWLVVPPDVAAAKTAFADLTAGGMARYTLPPPPWQPWITPDPLSAVISDNGAAKLRMDIPLPAGAWSSLPWGVIAGLVAVLLVCAALAITWLRRQNSEPLRARLTDISTGRQYDIVRWPATLGRSEGADITIANAHLAPLHLRFIDNGTGIEMRVIENEAVLLIGGEEKREHSLYRDDVFETAGISFRVEFLSGS